MEGKVEELDEQVDRTAVGNSYGSEEEVVNEFSATPLKRYVTFVQNYALKWTCNFGCKSEPYTGSYSRIRAHLIGLLPGQRAQGVALCSKVNKQEREMMKIEEAKAKKLFGDSRKPSLSVISTISPIQTVCSTGKLNAIYMEGSRDNVDLFKMNSRDEVDAAIASFFYANGIPFNVARSPFWFDMVKAINEAHKGYKPPSTENIRTSLLDKEKNKIDKVVMPLKEQWPIYGVSIISDGWTNIKNQILINVKAVSGGKVMFITGIDGSRDENTGSYVAQILTKAIEYVGIYNVVQLLTDDSSACKSAGNLIEAKHPHIFWSVCMAHTLSLLIKDIAHLQHPTLGFVSDVYSRAKAIVKYIKNHSSVLCIFRAFPALDVFLIKKTRFGSHFILLDRVSRMKNTLISMVLSDKWENIKKGHSYVEHDVVEKSILDTEFWNKANLILAFTKPVWLMIHLFDSDKAFIGEVYPRMEDMLSYIKEVLGDKLEMYQAMEYLVMERWGKINHPLHCLAYVLTPYYYSQSWLKSLAPGGQKRRKPHADNDIDAVYLNVVDRIVRDPKERSLIRHQLSNFFSNRGTFGRPQAIEDRETMPALTWWDLYGVTVPELYNLAVKVLSQSVNTSCGERAWNTYPYIRRVKRNVMNAERAESLLYVHYNHHLLSRQRKDYEETCRNWDTYADDDNLENDIEAIEDRECALLHDNYISIDAANSSCGRSCIRPQVSFGSTSIPQQRSRKVSHGKRPRVE